MEFSTRLNGKILCDNISRINITFNVSVKAMKVVHYHIIDGAGSDANSKSCPVLPIIKTLF